MNSHLAALVEAAKLGRQELAKFRETAPVAPAQAEEAIRRLTDVLQSEAVSDALGCARSNRGRAVDEVGSAGRSARAVSVAVAPTLAHDAAAQLTAAQARLNDCSRSAAVSIVLLTALSHMTNDRADDVGIVVGPNTLVRVAFAD